MKRKKIQKKSNSPDSRRGFVPLGQFQIEQVGKTPSPFEPDAIKVGVPKPVPQGVSKPPPRRVTFYTLRHGDTRVTNYFLRRQIRDGGLPIASAKVIQGLLTLKLIEPSDMKGFLNLGFQQLKRRTEELLREL